MPQLSQTFDSYPVSIVLDGSGNGTLTFQPNGSSISVSRLFVMVSTSVRQASVTLYKGSTNASNAIGTIVSGSTGGLASGQIFLSDGQTLYVVWSGGDAGATATATFSGKQISFNEIGSDSITWSDPVAASDGTLVFPGIKSNNYVANTSGWIINRDGSYELGSNGTFRGNLTVNGTNGSQVKVTTVGSQAAISLTPPNYVIAPGVTTNNPALIEANINDTGPAGYSQLVLSGAYPNTRNFPLISLNSESVDGTTLDNINIDSTQVDIVGKILTVGSWDIGGGIQDEASSTSNSGNISTTMTAVLVISNFVFNAGRAYEIEMLGGVNSTASGTGADFRVFKSTGTTLGTEIGEFYRVPCSLGASVVGAYGKMQVKNTSGSAIITDVALGLASTSGAATVSHQAGVGRQRALTIKDVGNAGDFMFANATVL